MDGLEVSRLGERVLEKCRSTGKRVALLWSQAQYAYRRLVLDGSKSAETTLDLAIGRDRLVGVYDEECHRQWIEEDIRWFEEGR